MVQPVEKWGPFYKNEDMLDGTNVDMMIRKKRTHKTIMAETFDPEKNARFRLKKRNGGARTT